MKRKFKMSKNCLVSLSNMVMRGKWFFTPHSLTKWHSLKYHRTCWIWTSNSSDYECGMQHHVLQRKPNVSRPKSKWCKKPGESGGNCLAWFTFQPWRWSQYVHLKHQATSELYSITIQNTGLSILKTCCNMSFEKLTLSHPFSLPP